jgi:preprotein translocase subunit SecF
MIELFRNPAWEFIGNRRRAYLVSLVFILIGLGSIAVKGGLRYDIDFTGGTHPGPHADVAVARGLGKVGLGDSIIQQFGDRASTSSGCP